MSGDSLQIRIKVTRNEGPEWRDLILKGKLTGEMVHCKRRFCFYRFDLDAPLPLRVGMVIDADPDDMLTEGHALHAIFTSVPGRYLPTEPPASENIKG